jgi:hypothetical protein
MFDFTEADDVRPAARAQRHPQADKPPRHDGRLSRAHVLALQQSAGNAAVSRVLARTSQRRVGELRPAQPSRVIARAVAADATTMSITPEYALSLSDEELLAAITAVREHLDTQPDPGLTAVLRANLAVLEDERSSPPRLNQSQSGEAEFPPLIENAVLSVVSQIGEQMWSCSTDGVSSDLRSTERLEYALKLAKASNDVYAKEPDINADLGNLRRLDAAELRALGLNPMAFHSDSGYEAALYVDPETLPEAPRCLPGLADFTRRFATDNPELGRFVADRYPEVIAPEPAEPAAEARRHYVLANRGTEMLSPRDWKANVLQGIGKPARQYDEAVALGREVFDKLEGRVTFTGHSLGGGLASAQALATGAPAVTFNAAGLDEAIAERFANADGHQPKVAAYYVGGEILSGLQDMPAPDLDPLQAIVASEMDSALGERIELSSHGVLSALLPPFAAYQHGIHPMIEALTAERDASLRK